MDAPVCTIIAGPNGAGKTTFALKYLPRGGECRNFVNADLIASGLSPLAPERERIAAGRVLLTELRGFVRRRETFAFETTLAGRTYQKLVGDLLKGGWEVRLIYLWVRSIQLSRERVAERVAHGGHGIADELIVRRYPRSVANLLNRFAPMCSFTTCLDNSGPDPELIFTQTRDGRVVENGQLYRMLRDASKPCVT